MFLARDPDRSRSVAVKIFRLDITPEQAGELVVQLAALSHANLTHPSIVAPLDAGIESTVAYLVSDFVPAESLDAAIRQYGPAPAAQAIRILTSVAAALDFAAAAGVHHGALHPRDVLVTPDDTHITGIGVGRALETIGLRAPMRRPYVAPERVQRESWDGRADVYSLGVLARELLVGRSRLDDEGGPDPRLPEDRADRLLPLIARATTARPADRFSTSLDFVGALQDALSGSRPRTSAAVADVDEEPRRVREARARRGTHDLLLPLDADAIDEPSVPPAAPFVDIEHDIRVPEAPAPEPAAFRDSTDALAHLEIDADRTDIAQRPDAIDLPGIEDGVAPDAQAFGQDRLEGDSRFTGEEEEPEEVVLGDTERIRAALLDGPKSTGSGEPATFAPLESVGTPASGFPGVVPGLDRDIVAPPDVTTRERKRSWGLPLLMLIVGLVLGAAGVGFLLGQKQAGTTRTASTAAQPQDPATSTSTGPAGATTSAPLSVVAPPPGPGVGAVDHAPAISGAAPNRATSAGAGERAAGGPGGVAVPPPRATTAKVNGVIVVRSSPSGASVAVNGRRRGSTPVRLSNLAVGKYTVRVSREGYATEQRDVLLSADRPSSTLTFALNRSKPSGPASRTEAANPTDAGAATRFFGSLSVESLPAGAEVFLDGRLIGTTPLVSARIPAGSHVVRVNRTGFRPWTTAIQVVSGQRVRVTASLERDST